MSLLNPLLVFAVSIGLFVFLLYRRVGLGVSLTSTAFVMSFLSLGFYEAGIVLFKTCLDAVTLTLVFATLFIMLLSQLYKETGLINILSRNLGGLIRDSKVIVSLLPAVIGLMPVAGGALMSAPMVDVEAEKLGLDKAKKTYVNLWFRHTILPIYPISQFLILTALLTETTIFPLIYRQFPIVITMIIIGYLIGLRKAQTVKRESSEANSTLKADLKGLLFSFSPIITTVFLTAVLNVNIAIATLVGILVLSIIMKAKVNVFGKILKDWSVWEVPLAAFGALLLRNVTLSSGISEILGGAVANANLNEVVLLLSVPAALAFLLGSPSGGIALSVPILAETVIFTPKTASLLYISAYLGYLSAPTHLCLALTAQYFKCSISKIYKYLIPSVIVSVISALVIYFLF